MVYDIYSKRSARLAGQQPDFYQYNCISEKVKNHIIILWERLGVIDHRSTIDALGSQEMFSAVAQALREEYGVLQLVPRRHGANDTDEVIRFFLSHDSAGECLDVVELIIRSTKTLLFSHDPKTHQEMIDTVNFRFREGGVGFQYEVSQIIRVDHQFTHTEITKPALLLLQEAGFEGANAEFLRAHEHYRNGNYKECLVESSKTLESTIKVICKQRRWDTEGDTASKLMNVILFQRVDS